MSRLGTAVMTVYDVKDGDSPVYSRYYSTYPGLYSEMGDPTTPGTGVTWTLATGSVPDTAYWIAERYTISGGTPSAWQLLPVQAKDSGLPFVTGIKSGFNKPTLGSATWISDAVAAVAAFTGRPYSNQKEFGYGTTVVIEYDDGKLSGRYTRDTSTNPDEDTWVSPASFIDGDLIVDGTIAADHIQSNAITADKISASAITADKIAAGVITADKIAAGSITADKLQADSITANEIKSVDGSAIISRTYRLDGTNNRVDATVGIDRGTASPGRYYWLDSDDIDTGGNFVFPEEAMNRNRINRWFKPSIVNDGVVVDFSEYQWQWQSIGSSTVIYDDGGSSGTSTMYDNGGTTGSFYQDQTLEESGWQAIEAKSFTQEELTYYRVVPTSGTSIPVVSSGDVKFSLVVFASGEEDISSITLSGSSGSYTLE